MARCGSASRSRRRWRSLPRARPRPGTSALFSGAIFIGAGLYQFTSLKHACLTQCQRPFPFFFAHWQTTPRGVFRLGLQQGLYCLGCCWAMMLVMFAVGVMNVVWMAALGIVMTVEKMLSGPRFSQAVGVALIAIGVACRFDLSHRKGNGSEIVSEAWTLKGEMALSCSCTVFCPCVISLGNHPPTEDRCQTWAGIRIDEGHFDAIDLSGIKVGLMMDLPGIMARGNWTAALFVDDKAPIQAVKGLTRIFTGRVGGTTHLLSILVGQFLGVQQVPIEYETEGETRHIRIEKYVDGAITPVPRQAARRERGGPQQRILDRPRRHRGARRQVALPRLRPQLEFRRPFGRDRQARLGRINSLSFAQARAFAIHVFTASGTALAFLSLILATGGHWAAMFFCLGAALLVDGLDGPLARRFRVAEVLPRWSGETLDLVVDFLTYVFVPAYAIAASGLLPPSFAILGGVIVCITGALYFADREMKTDDNYFRGFPGDLESRRLLSLCAGAAALDRRRGADRAGDFKLRADPLPASLARRALSRVQYRAARHLGRAGLSRGRANLQPGPLCDGPAGRYRALFFVRRSLAWPT